jgi:hypothetical protein
MLKSRGQLSSPKTDPAITAANPDPKSIQDALKAVADYSAAYVKAVEPVFTRHEHSTLAAVFDALRYLAERPEEERELRDRYGIADARSPNPHLAMVRWLYSSAHEHLRSPTAMSKYAGCIALGLKSKWTQEKFAHELKTAGGIEGVYAQSLRKNGRSKPSAKAQQTTTRRDGAISAVLEEYEDTPIRLPAHELVGKPDGDYLVAITLRKGVAIFRRFFDANQSRRGLARLLGMHA